MRADRLILALFLALLALTIRCEQAHAAWTEEVTGISWGASKTYCYYDSGNNDLWCLNLFGTSTATALLKVDLDGPSASVVTGPGAGSGTLQYQSLGIVDSTLYVSSAQRGYVQVSSCTLPACSSWSSVLTDNFGFPTLGGTLEKFATKVMHVLTRSYGSGRISVDACNSSFASCTSQYTGGAYDSPAGCKVSDSLYIGYGITWGPYLGIAGFDGSLAAAFTSGWDGIPNAFISYVGQCFSDGTAAISNIYYTAGDSYIVRITDAGSSYALDARTKSATELLAGATYSFDGAAAKAVMWARDGTAWSRGATSIDALTTANVTPGSGYTVRGAWYDTGMVSPRVITSNGTSAKVLKWSASSAAPRPSPSSPVTQAVRVLRGILP